MVVLPIPCHERAPANEAAPQAPRAWFAALLVDMQRALYARARLFSGQEEDARDAVQTTYERAWRKFSARVPRAHARAWVLRILENVLISAWRARRRACRPLLMQDLDAIAEPPAEPSPADQLGQDDVEAALACLSPALGETFRLCEIEGLSYDDAGARLGVPRATVGSRLFRARLQLRALLAPARP